MKFAYAALMAAWTACLCLSTPAEARCGDSGTCNHGRVYLKPVKTTTAKATARTTTVKTTRTTRAIAAKPKRTKQVQRVRAKKPVQTARAYRKPKAAASRTARLHKVSTTRMALSFPVKKKASYLQDLTPKSTSHASRSGGAKSGAQVVAMIKTMAPQYGVPTWFALRIAKIESGYNPTLRGAAGEYGVFQMKCPTARGLGFEGDCSGLADARTNVRWGLEHLSAALKSSGGNLHLAASKHNGGLGRKTIIRKYVNLVF